jgi:integrase
MAYHTEKQKAHKRRTFAKEEDMRSSFSLYKKQTQQGLVWYARFWNEKAGKFTEFRSTGIRVSGKKGRQQEAWNQAMTLLPTITFEGATSGALVANKQFLEYVAGFWTRNSDYIKDCENLKKKPLSLKYIRGNADVTRLHLAPFEPFQKLALKEFTAGHIRAWMRWATENGRSARLVNSALSAMRIAVRYAVTNEELDRDPFKNIGEAMEQPKEMGILSQEEVSKLIHSPIKNPHDRAVILLAVLCSLRRGEIRGLMWGDIENGIIDINHNFVCMDGLKEPKRGSYRKIPIPKYLDDILEEIRKLSKNLSLNAYIFESPIRSGQPLGETYFRNAFSRELEAIGIPGKWQSRKPMPKDYINEQERRNLKLHGLRHNFVTLGRLSGISDMEIQALAGHKSARMMEHYSHAKQVLDFPSLKAKIEQAYLTKTSGRNE